MASSLSFSTFETGEKINPKSDTKRKNKTIKKKKNNPIIIKK